MKLSDYIAKLQELQAAEGDLPLYTSKDDEGNGYNKVYALPELYFLGPEENEYRPEYLISPMREGEAVEDWIGSHCLDEDEVLKDGKLNLSTFQKVILL